MRYFTALLLIGRLLWALPCSLLGLLLGCWVLICGGRMRWVDGALECAFKPRSRLAAGLLRRQRFIAITLGHVIVALRQEDLRRWHAHERVHVRQFETLGPLMLLAYPTASAWAWVRGQDAYWGNYFERQAYRIECDAKSKP